MMESFGHPMKAQAPWNQARTASIRSRIGDRTAFDTSRKQALGSMMMACFERSWMSDLDLIEFGDLLLDPGRDLPVGARGDEHHVADPDALVHLHTDFGRGTSRSRRR